MGAGITSSTAGLQPFTACGSYVGGTGGDDFTISEGAPTASSLGGGSSAVGSGLATPAPAAVAAASPIAPQPTTTPSAGAAATSSVGGAGSAPNTDLFTAIATLTELVTKLTAIISAMQGASAVQGGGAPGQGLPSDAVETPASCVCGAPGGTAEGLPAEGAPVKQVPAQATPVQATPAPVPTVATPPVDAAPADPAPQKPQGAPEQTVAASPGQVPMPPASGDVRQRIVQIAQGELDKGVREDAGQDRDHAGVIAEYRRAVTAPGEDPNAAEPWCADFASWVSKAAGVPIGPNGQGEDYTVAVVDWAKSQGRWQDRAASNPLPGDLVLMDWDQSGQPDHIAIVEKVENGKVTSIGGNEGPGEIQRSTYDLGDGQILGYVTPG